MKPHTVEVDLVTFFVAETKYLTVEVKGEKVSFGSQLAGTGEGHHRAETVHGVGIRHKAASSWPAFLFFLCWLSTFCVAPPRTELIPISGLI